MASTFGTINNPLPSTSYGNVGTGLPLFITNSVRLVFAAAGIFAFFNLVLGGFYYISSGGDVKKIEAASASIYMSLIGLAVMVAAAAATSIISYLLFGDATAILAPKIIGPGTIGN